MSESLTRLDSPFLCHHVSLPSALALSVLSFFVAVMVHSPAWFQKNPSTAFVKELGLFVWLLLGS